MYIKLPMYLFFIWRLDFMILMRENPLLGPLEAVGPENITFVGPKGGFVCSNFRTQNSLDFPDPFQWALETNFPPSKSVRPAP
jgi:hypothetical protein